MAKSKHTRTQGRKLNGVAETHQKATGNASALTTNQGVRIPDDQNSLTGGSRGPTLLEDFILREKITHFDHERIPERIVHARGSAAHGYFQAYKSMRHVTSAAFLSDPKIKTPVFARFSTVAGGAGSVDLPRDVRGFAVKFYTQEGNFDLVGNNIPVFFIQDAMKFPDLIHAVKMEPDRGFPQAASAHDTFWDFISLMPESLHMIMWAMSDRAIPALAADDGRFRRQHLSPGEQGRRSQLRKVPLASDHRQQLRPVGRGGEDQRRRSRFPSPRSLGGDRTRQLSRSLSSDSRLWISKQPTSLDFDVLDATKLVPEEIVPIEMVGKMVLDRNPDNFFAETEQVAFCPANIVPGIDFSEDPLLQGRLFSYLDTQLIRLGGPNFHQIPINRPEVSVREPSARRPHADRSPQGPGCIRAEYSGSSRPARNGRAFFSVSSRSCRRYEVAAAARFVRGPLLAGAPVLPFCNATGAAPHDQGSGLRIRESADSIDPQAYARPLEHH